MAIPPAARCRSHSARWWATECSLSPSLNHAGALQSPAFSSSREPRCTYKISIRSLRSISPIRARSAANESPVRDPGSHLSGHRATRRSGATTGAAAGPGSRRDPLCGRRIEVRQHDDDVTGLRKIRRSPFIPGAPPPWPTAPHPSGYRKSSKPYAYWRGTPGPPCPWSAAPCRQRSAVCGSERLGESPDSPDRRIAAAGGGAAVGQPSKCWQPLWRPGTEHVADRAARDLLRLGLRATWGHAGGPKNVFART